MNKVSNEVKTIMLDVMMECLEESEPDTLPTEMAKKYAEKVEAL